MIASNQWHPIKSNNSNGVNRIVTGLDFQDYSRGKQIQIKTIIVVMSVI